jgi:hypothetical protein
MPVIQGYVNASFADMIAVFGWPQRAEFPSRVQWTLPGGTVLFDFAEDGPLDELDGWMIGGQDSAAVDLVIAAVSRAGRFGQVERPASRTNRETVFIGPAARGAAA